MRKPPHFCDVFTRSSFWDGPGRQYSKSTHVITTDSMERAISHLDPFQREIAVPLRRASWGVPGKGWGSL